MFETKDDTPGGGVAPEGQEADTQPQGEGEGQQPEGGEQQPTEYEVTIDGQTVKLTAEQVAEAVKAASDYQQLVPEFTRRSQRLAEYEKLGDLDELQKQLAKPDDDTKMDSPEVVQAKKILKEMGFVEAKDVETLQQQIQQVMEVIQGSSADAQLEKVSAKLAATYDGKRGEPPFKLEEIAAAVQQNPALAVYVHHNGQFLVDLEATYKRVHADFWGKIPEMKAKVVKTERGSGPQTTTPQTRKEAETEEEKIAQAVDFFRSAQEAGQEE